MASTCFSTVFRPFPPPCVTFALACEAVSVSRYAFGGVESFCPKGRAESSPRRRSSDSAKGERKTSPVSSSSRGGAEEEEKSVMNVPECRTRWEGLLEVGMSSRPGTCQIGYFPCSEIYRPPPPPRLFVFSIERRGNGRSTKERFTHAPCRRPAAGE